jgi:hypothetical protein
MTGQPDTPTPAQSTTPPAGAPQREAVLKPCAHCGGMAFERRSQYGFRIQCGSCGIALDWSRNEAETIAAWNRRTPTPAESALVERLRALRAQIQPGVLQVMVKSAQGWGAPESNYIAALLDAESAILAALTAPREPGWRTIDSAPRDRLIDIWIDNGDGSGVRWCDCSYDTICDQWRVVKPGERVKWIPARFVTHWRPAPPAPEAGDG